MSSGRACSVFEDVDVWDAVRRFVAAGLDKHCFRAAQSLFWSQIACCMAAEGLLLESEELTPQALAALSEEERPPEHQGLFLEMHAIRMPWQHCTLSGVNCFSR